MPKIFMYWEDIPNQRRHTYIDLCREIIHRHCQDDFDIVLITPDNINHYLPGKDYSFIRCAGARQPTDHIAVKVGCIRVALLHKYGGIWIDMDVVLLRSLSFLWELANQHGFVGVESEKYSKVLNTIMAAKPGSSVMEEYIVQLENRLSTRQPFKWAEIGANMLTPILQRSRDKYILPEHSFLPISWEVWELFFSEQAEVEDYLREDTYGFILFNRLFPNDFKQLDREGVLKSQALIGKLFRRALADA